MKKYAAIITTVHTSKEVVTLSADNEDKAFRLAGELADELVEEGTIGVDDVIDIDVIDLVDVSHISDEAEPDAADDSDCVTTLAELIRFSRDTDGELPDRVLARIFLDGMRACAED
jgi:ArsR family metal-binding transcriptional regulator